MSTEIDEIATEIAEDSTRLFSILKEEFADSNPDRYQKLLRMYDDYGDELIKAPASGKIHYHNAFPGGYLSHILHVYDVSLNQTRILKEAGSTIDFTKEELTMATLHHDLWKLGLPDMPYYIPQESKWHQENKNETYIRNEKLPYMKVTDGALFILQKYGIELTHKEWSGIKLSDGLYDDANKSYMLNESQKYPIHTNLPYIVHWSDHVATIAEKDPLKQEFLR